MADLGSSLQSVLQVPGLQEMLNQAVTQQRQAAPLRTAINQQAVNMLPNSAFTRPDMAAIPQANFSTPPPSDGMSPLIAALLGAGGGAGLTLLLQKLLGNKGGSSSGGGSGGSTGAGSSFSFGHNSIAGYLHDLFTKPNGDQHPDAQGGLQIPGGEFDPGKVYGGSEPAYQTTGPWEQNDPSSPFANSGGGDSGSVQGDNSQDDY